MANWKEDVRFSVETLFFSQVLILRPALHCDTKKVVVLHTKAFIAPMISENKTLSEKNSQLHSCKKRIIPDFHEN